MIPLLRLARSASLLAAIFLLATVCGCASPSNNSAAIIAADEQVYIDLKQGFALVIPATWKREKIPVSSPQYRSDTVNWILFSGKSKIGTLQIRALGHPDQSSPQDYLCDFLNEQNELHHSETIELEHSAGQVLRLNGEETDYRVIYLVIEGEKLSYLAAFKISAKAHDDLLPSVEKVIKSFSILHPSDS